MIAEWRYKKSEINITKDTIIPKLPAKPLQEPSDAAYHAHQIECDEKIDGLYKDLNDFVKYSVRQLKLNVFEYQKLYLAKRMQGAK